MVLFLKMMNILYIRFKKMKKIFKKIGIKADTDFFKGVFVLASGTTIAQAIPILISPILTRIYTPEDFGVLSLYLSIISVCSIIAAGRYELAIVLPEKDEDGMSLLVLSILIVFCVSVLIVVVGFLSKNIIRGFFGDSRIFDWFYFIPLSTVLLGVFQACNSWLTRTKKFKQISVSKVGQATISSLAKLTFGIIHLKGIGLILGDVLGQITSVLIMGKEVFLNNRIIMQKISFNSLISMMKRYSDFPKYYLLSALLDSFTVSYPVFVISKIYGIETTGYYGLMTRTIAIPSIIIANSVSQVYFQRIVEIRNVKGNIKSFVNKAIKFLVSVAFPITLILFFWGPFLFSFVFGKKWLMSGEYARIFSFTFLIRFVTSPLSMIFAAVEKVKVGASWQIICFITTLLTLYIASNYNITTFLIIFAIHDIILYGFYLYLIINTAKNDGR